VVKNRVPPVESRAAQHGSVAVCALLAIPLAFTAVVYWPLTQNYFYSDDFLNLYRIRNDSLIEYLLTPHGGHVLVTRNALFYLFAHAFGTQPRWYFAVVLLTHLLNTLLLFRVIRRLTDSPRLACLGAALWGTSPVHEGSLGWYSVYGHVVVGTAVLLILDFVTRTGTGMIRPTRRVLRWCYVLALLACTSFGVGIGLAVVLPFVVVLLAPQFRPLARRGVPLLSLVVVAPGVYLAVFWLHGAAAPEGIGTPQALTEAAFHFWAAIPAHLARLIGYAVFRLVAGFFFTPPVFYFPTAYETAASYACFAVVVLSCAIVAWRSPGAVRNQIAACLLMTVATYGMITLGRVWLADLAAIQSRYHYVGLIPLTAIVCIVLARVGAARRIDGRAKNALLALSLGTILVAHWRSGFALDHHPEARQQTDQVLGQIRARIAAAQPGETVTIANARFAQLFPPIVPMADFPGWAAVFVVFYPDNTVDGRRVTFFEKDQASIKAAAAGKRSAGLLVPPPS
jgi:hypothetical protein